VTAIHDEGGGLTPCEQLSQGYDCSHRCVEGNTCMACTMYILTALDTVQFSILISEHLKFHPLCYQTLVMESGGADDNCFILVCT
jgi:hypothetical protein